MANHRPGGAHVVPEAPVASSKTFPQFTLPQALLSTRSHVIVMDQVDVIFLCACVVLVILAALEILPRILVFFNRLNQINT